MASEDDKERLRLVKGFEQIKEVLKSSNPIWPHETQVITTIGQPVAFRRNRLFLYHWIAFWNLNDIDDDQLSRPFDLATLDPFALLSKINQNKDVIQPMTIKQFCTKSIHKFLEFHKCIKKCELKLLQDDRKDLFNLANFNVEISPERLKRVWHYHKKLNDESNNPVASDPPAYIGLVKTPRVISSKELQKSQKTRRPPTFISTANNENEPAMGVSDQSLDGFKIKADKVDKSNVNTLTKRSSSSSSSSNTTTSTTATAHSQRERSPKIYPVNIIFTECHRYKLSELRLLLKETRFISRESMVNEILNDYYKDKMPQRCHNYLWKSLGFKEHYDPQFDIYKIEKAKPKDLVDFWNGIEHTKYIGLEN